MEKEEAQEECSDQEFDYYLSDEGDISQMLFNNGICLPSGTNLSIDDQEKIIDIILSINH